MLPNSSVEEEKKFDFAFVKRDYDYKRAFFSQKEMDKVKIDTLKQDYVLLSKIKLNALYSIDKNRAWIVVEEKASGKTTILSVNEEYKGYLLKEVYKTFAIFEKNSKLYKLNMKEEKLKYEVKE
ncbi:hypothetical protein [Halarcobacter ebronensis]|uniref:hypothetical protein n=1 Tax=Halarcobacter ebronensis TaxID=1462615 RepID=UPI0013E9401B|nr:hypothetical protein [Halarcobacter ebronensis]